MSYFWRGCRRNLKLITLGSEMVNRPVAGLVSCNPGRCVWPAPTPTRCSIPFVCTAQRRPVRSLLWREDQPVWRQRQRRRGEWASCCRGNRNLSEFISGFTRSWKDHGIWNLDSRPTHVLVTSSVLSQDIWEEKELTFSSLAESRQRWPSCNSSSEAAQPYPARVFGHETLRQNTPKLSCRVG